MQDLLKLYGELVIELIKKNISIRLKFSLYCIISIVIGVLTNQLLYSFLVSNEKGLSNTIKSFENECKTYEKEIFKDFHDNKKTQKIIDEIFLSNNRNYEVYIVNNDGKIILKPSNSDIMKLDLNNIKRKKVKLNESVIRCYYIKVLPNKNSLIITSILKKNDLPYIFPLSILISITVFIMLSYKRIKYISTLTSTIEKIGSGNINLHVPIVGNDELTTIAKQINIMVINLNNREKKAKELEKSKNDLVLSLSHDLKTPLTSVIGYSNLLQSNYNNRENLLEITNIIIDKAQNINEIISDLFEYTKFTGSEFKLEKSKFSLTEIIRQTIESLIPMCKSNNISIILDPVKENITVNADTNLIVRVFENLLTNAIKYAKKPSNINVSIENKNTEVIIEIFNKGRKFDDLEFEKLFTKYYRSNIAKKSNTEGHGIGLNIAKNIIDLHKGKIWAENKTNGVSFYVLLRKT